MGATIDLTGDKIDRLTVIGRNLEEQEKRHSADSYWDCVCDCGNHVVVSGRKLRGQSVGEKSCGKCDKDGRQKKVLRQCQFIGCRHETRDIDISTEEYELDGRRYYHPDCYDLKTSQDWKTEKTKEDLRKIREIWYERISKTCVWSQLMQILNGYVASGIDSEYLLFVIQYVIEHGYKLRYPNGYRYYVDNKEIKEAYGRRQAKALKMQFKAAAPVQPQPTPASTYTYKPVKRGFGQVLGGDQ